MKTALLVGGPLILFLGFSLYSDLLTYGEQHPGLMHIGGVEPGGTFSLQHKEVYQCDESGANCVLVEESTEISEIEELEIEQEPIEYREGDETTIVRKLDGLNKYGPIYLRRGSDVDFDWKSWKFVFERQVALDEVNKEYDEKLKEMQEAEE